MGFIGSTTPHRTGGASAPARPAAHRSAHPSNSKTAADRVNWLFSGVMLGAATWLLVLGVVFAAFGNWIVASGLFGGLSLCLAAMWRAARRLRRVPG